MVLSVSQVPDLDVSTNLDLLRSLSKVQNKNPETGFPRQQGPGSGATRRERLKADSPGTARGANHSGKCKEKEKLVLITGSFLGIGGSAPLPLVLRDSLQFWILQVLSLLCHPFLLLLY
jgi:hypothetical protein